MWPFRRRKPNRRSLSDMLDELKPPPVIGTADYQAANPFADGADATRWRAPDAPTREVPPMPDEKFAAPEDPAPINIRPGDTGSHHVSDDRIEAARAEREQAGKETWTPGLATQEMLPPADSRDDCPHCQGTGKVLTKSDLLRASLALLGEDPRVHDMLIVDFYDRLFLRAGYLAAIFPADLRDPNAQPDGRGKAQRDKLLAALIALGTTYDPDNADAMRVLDEHLALFGRSHAAFGFPDGVRPPTLREYVVVEDVLLRLLADVLTDRWLPEFHSAWTEALDYASRKMSQASWEVLQERGGQLHPRSVRR